MPGDTLSASRMFGLLLRWAQHPCTRLGIPPGDASQGPALLLPLGWGCHCVQGGPCCRHLRVPGAHDCVASFPPVLTHIHTWMRGDMHSGTHGCHIFSVSLWTHEHPQFPRIYMDTHMCAHTACHTHTFPLPLGHRALSPSSLSAVTTHLQKGTRAPPRRLMALPPPPPRSESTMSPSRLAQPPPGPPSPSPRLR